MSVLIITKIHKCKIVFSTTLIKREKWKIYLKLDFFAEVQLFTTIMCLFEFRAFNFCGHKINAFVKVFRWSIYRCSIIVMNVIVQDAQSTFLCWQNSKESTLVYDLFISKWFWFYCIIEFKKNSKENKNSKNYHRIIFKNILKTATITNAIGPRQQYLLKVLQFCLNETSFCQGITSLF